MRPLPRIKRILSDATHLPHIVQLLLTFDPILVEKVSTLLHLVMQDNPALPRYCSVDSSIVLTVCGLVYFKDHRVSCRLYLTGAFFFIMMYTGSNVLPVARLLKHAHLRQAFRCVVHHQKPAINAGCCQMLACFGCRSDESVGSDIMQRSVLGHILPEAMVCYLENYEPEKFAQIFLGEFDTPEAIWSSEMR